MELGDSALGRWLVQIEQTWRLPPEFAWAIRRTLGSKGRDIRRRIYLCNARWCPFIVVRFAVAFECCQLACIELPVNGVLIGGIHLRGKEPRASLGRQQNPWCGIDA